MPCETDFTLVGGFRGNLYPIWFWWIYSPLRRAYTHDRSGEFPLSLQSSWIFSFNILISSFSTFLSIFHVFLRNFHTEILQFSFIFLGFFCCNFITFWLEFHFFLRHSSTIHNFFPFYGMEEKRNWVKKRWIPLNFFKWSFSPQISLFLTENHSLSIVRVFISRLSAFFAIDLQFLSQNSILFSGKFL